MVVTVIATGFPGMNGEFVPSSKASSFMDNNDDDLLSAFNTVPSVSSRPAAANRAPAPVSSQKDDDTFSDIMSIFGRK